MANLAALTLANICLDVQIGICMYLHPSDILALRKTCKSLQPSTRQRVVWEAALHRVCLDNALFLPSFPISDMSDLEIEKAAMGPRRWIDLCAAFEKQHLKDSGATLCPRSTRSIRVDDLLAAKIRFTNTDLFIVPGGRYLVSTSSDGISVLDLGYTSSSDCKLIASVGPEGRSTTCNVQATPDGIGLIILSSGVFEKKKNWFIYEIYPQSDMPHLTQIAHLDFECTNDFYLLPGKVIWYGFSLKGIIFRVWDYRVNHSTSFSLDFDNSDVSLSRPEVIATKTAVIVVYDKEMLIWSIPSLSPHADSSFFAYNSTHLPPPLFTIALPDGIVRQHFGLNVISSWYCGSSNPLYFDMICQDSKLRRCQITLKPDLSSASLHIINTYPHNSHWVSLQNYRICEDALVSFWVHDNRRRNRYQCGVYTSAKGTSHRSPAPNMLLPDIGRKYVIFSCPASGRFVRLDSTDGVAILDFF